MAKTKKPTEAVQGIFERMSRAVILNRVAAFLVRFASYPLNPAAVALAIVAAWGVWHG